MAITEAVRVFMTSEPLYEKLLRDSIGQYTEECMSIYNTFTIPASSDDIEVLMANKRAIKQNLDTLRGMPPEKYEFDVGSAVKKHFEPSIKEVELLKTSIQEQRIKKIQDLEDKRNAAILNEEKKAAEATKPISDKHAELMSFKEPLKEILIRYNIMPSDIKISDDITSEEFMALVDSSISVCKSLTKERKSMSRILYWPLEEGDTKFSAYYLLLIALVFYFGAPFIAVILIGYMLYSTSTIYKKIDRLRIAESLMYNVDFSRFQPEISKEVIAEVDTTEIDEWAINELKRIEENHPQKLCDAEMAEVTKNIDKISRKCYDTYKSMEEYYKRIIHSLETAEKETDEKIKVYLDGIKEFGTVINTSAVMSHDFTVGYIDKVVPIIEHRELKNMVFQSKDRSTMIQRLRVYLCNAILSVKEKHLTVTIYDPENLGAEFADFYSNETQEYVKIETKDHVNILNRLRDYTQNNIKIIGDSNIDEYNKASEAVGKITLDYELLVVLSDVKKVKETEGFAKFMEYSARYGTIVWLCDTVSYPNADMVATEYSHKGQPMEYTSALGVKVTQTLNKAIQEGKIEGIMYFTDFAPKILPKEKWWTGNTTKGVNMRFGYADGDPSKGYPMHLDDKNVHCLMVGGTGSGKSVTINEMLMSLCTEYSPNELELVMIDFKNVEFSTFSRQEDTGVIRKIDKKTKAVISEEILPNIRNMPLHKSIIPHARVLAGTKDGEYAVSIFDYLCDEMQRRTEIFSKAGCKNIMEYRDKFPDAIMPRIVCLIDEFQVMFTEVDPKIVDIIKGKITSLSKLARFCGCHLWFTSQSMKGTLDKDILEQFTLRVALRCASTVSQDIIGNNAAGKIKSKVGYCYTNDSAGEDPTRNVLWRLPFAPTDDIMRTLEKLIVMCKERNIPMRDTDFYDQKLTFPKERLDEMYEMYPEHLLAPRLMILGERTGYSLNKLPEHFKFTKDDGENLAAVAFERSDLLNLVMTFVDNIRHKGSEAMIVMHSADRDAHTMLDIPSIVPEGLVSISDPNQDMEALVDALSDMVENRKNQDPSTLKPLYFIGVQWEKAKAISREERPKTQDKFKAVLREAPLYDIHFLFFAKEIGDLPSFVYTACNHRIAAKCGEKESSKYLNSMRATRLPTADDGIFAIYQYGATDYKFKIYQHVFAREIESRTVMVQ